MCVGLTWSIKIRVQHIHGRTPGYSSFGYSGSSDLNRYNGLHSSLLSSIRPDQLLNSCDGHAIGDRHWKTRKLVDAVGIAVRN
jgi:hypothetical protein